MLSSQSYLTIIFVINITFAVLITINVITTTCQAAHDDNVSEMGGPRGLAAFFFLGLSYQVSAAEEVFIVEGAGDNGVDGLYVEEGQGSSATAYYKRLGGADSDGYYYYLYRGTERQGTWVLGCAFNGDNFEENKDLYKDLTDLRYYRAPVGSAGEDAPPERGWQ